MKQSEIARALKSSHIEVCWNNVLVAARCRVSTTFVARFIGLLAHRSLGYEEGMMFVPGGGIHTFRMKFAIDVLFLDCEMQILDIRHHVVPKRVVRAPEGTRYVLELSAGRAATLGLHAGLELHLRPSTPLELEFREGVA